MECPNFQYAVKFVCGRSDGRVLAPGEYLTAINVHNPTDSIVPFQYKIAPALPQQKPTDFFDLKLEPDWSLEIDCPQILPEAQGAFRKGFVVIESDVELDVVAVYTVSGRGGQVSIHMERVPARRPIRLPRQG